MACSNCYHCRELDELKEALRNAGSPTARETPSIINPNCDRVGQHRLCEPRFCRIPGDTKAFKLDCDCQTKPHMGWCRSSVNSSNRNDPGSKEPK